MHFVPTVPFNLDPASRIAWTGRPAFRRGQHYVTQRLGDGSLVDVPLETRLVARRHSQLSRSMFQLPKRLSRGPWRSAWASICFEPSRLAVDIEAERLALDLGCGDAGLGNPLLTFTMGALSVHVSALSLIEAMCLPAGPFTETFLGHSGLHTLGAVKRDGDTIHIRLLPFQRTLSFLADSRLALGFWHAYPGRSGIQQYVRSVLAGETALGVPPIAGHFRFSAIGAFDGKHFICTTLNHDGSHSPWPLLGISNVVTAAGRSREQLRVDCEDQRSDSVVVGMECYGPVSVRFLPSGETTVKGLDYATAQKRSVYVRELFEVSAGTVAARPLCAAP